METGAVCPVCRCALGDDARLCVSCGAPHHHDCWEYIGHCAIYGCCKMPRRQTALISRRSFMNLPAGINQDDAAMYAYEDAYQRSQISQYTSWETLSLVMGVFGSAGLLFCLAGSMLGILEIIQVGFMSFVIMALSIAIAVYQRIKAISLFNSSYRHEVGYADADHSDDCIRFL